MRGPMNPKRRRKPSLSILLIFSIVGDLVFCGSEWSGIGTDAFTTLSTQTRLHSPPATREAAEPMRQSPSVLGLSNSNNNSNNNNNKNNNSNNNNKNNGSNPFDLDLLARRFERADKREIRNDATLVACYVLCRFLIYDVTSGTKIQPGWEIQDWIWLTGTFSSATVLVVYYVIAGLLSRTYEVNTTFAVFGPSPVVRTLVNVALCCPVWLATEHLLGFGPADIGGDTLAIAVATGFVGFGSFMALAKTLTAGMR